MKRRIGVQGFLMFVSLLTVAICWRYLLSAAKTGAGEQLIDLLGIVMVLAGYLLRIDARGYKAALNPDGKTLVTQGPYALMRNPMYMGTLSIGLGLTMILFRWWVSMVFVAVYLLIYLPQIKKEEAALSARFGSAFGAYARITPGFFLTLATLSRALRTHTVRLQRAWVDKEFISFMVTMGFVIGVEVWKNLFLQR